MTLIVESYKNYNPPKSVPRAIERLLSKVDQRRIIGLHSIILTNSASLNHKYRRRKTISRKKKVMLKDCNGWYCEQSKREPAHIKLLIDNILSTFPNWATRFNFVLDIVLSKTLYHEIGHHIHRTQVPEYSEAEDVAEKWRSKLQKSYIKRRYWYILAFIYPLFPILNLIEKYRTKENSTKP
jgi:hypothetical protein